MLLVIVFDIGVANLFHKQHQLFYFIHIYTMLAMLALYPPKITQNTDIIDNKRHPWEVSDLGAKRTAWVYHL